MESEQSELKVIDTLPSVDSSDHFREDTLHQTEQSVVDQAPNELVATVGDESPGTSSDTAVGDTSIDITVNMDRKIQRTKSAWGECGG